MNVNLYSIYEKLNSIEVEIAELKEEMIKISSILSVDSGLSGDLKNLVTNIIANLYVNHRK